MNNRALGFKWRNILKKKINMSLPSSHFRPYSYIIEKPTITKGRCENCGEMFVAQIISEYFYDYKEKKYLVKEKISGNICEKCRKSLEKLGILKPEKEPEQTFSVVGSPSIINVPVSYNYSSSMSSGSYI